MFKIERKHLGSSTILSPAQQVQRWSTNNMMRIVFAFVASALWFGVVFIGCGLMVFFGINMLRIWTEDEITAMQIFNMPVTWIVKIVGCILLFIYILISTKKTK